MPKALTNLQNQSDQPDSEQTVIPVIQWTTPGANSSIGNNTDNFVLRVRLPDASNYTRRSGHLIIQYLIDGKGIWP